MKLSTKQGLRAGVGFGLVFGVMTAAVHGAIVGAAEGAVGGILFGLFVAWAVRRKERLWATLRQAYEAEGVEHEGPASCALGAGYLILTSKRLVWLPISARERDKRIVIAREAIAKVDKAAGLGAQIRISVTTGESVQFLVTDRKTWLERLRAARAPLPEARVVR